jgi:hypothetical protein
MEYTLEDLERFIAEEQEDTPRMKCLKKCQNELHACLAKAGSDENKKAACTKALNDCLKLCPQN